jgi:lysozyme
MMQRLRDMIKRHEGVESHVYKDHLGLETIGVGRCIAPNSLGLSDDEIDYLLDNDIVRCIKELTRALPWFSSLDDVRTEALIDLCFNLGLTRLLGFKKALAAMAISDWETAKVELLDSRWATQVGNRAQEIAEMIRTGVYQQS